MEVFSLQGSIGGAWVGVWRGLPEGSGEDAFLLGS